MTEKLRGKEPEKEGKRFHIGDVLSITTGRLVSPRHMEGLYDILNYMAGDHLSTHQLPRVGDECRPHLLAQHPDLEDVDASGVNEKNLQAWLKQQSEKYGETLPVKPLNPGEHRFIDPFQEAIDLKGPEHVGVIVVKEAPSQRPDLN